MENTEDIKKSCINCRHYVEHYIWDKYRFRQTACGHCAVNPQTKKFLKSMPLKHGCDKWENGEIKIAEREERIEKELRYTVKQINRIIKYFEKENG